MTQLVWDSPTMMVRFTSNRLWVLARGAFFDLFSMRLGSGYALQRKDGDGQVLAWRQEESKLRIQMLPCSYIELELVARSMFNEAGGQKEVSK